MIDRMLLVGYGLAAYVIALASVTYTFGFLAHVGVPSGIDDGQVSPLGMAILVNTALLGLFAGQHTVMARPAFKRLLTRFVPGGRDVELAVVGCLVPSEGREERDQDGDPERAGVGHAGVAGVRVRWVATAGAGLCRAHRAGSGDRGLRAAGPWFWRVGDPQAAAGGGPFVAGLAAARDRCLRGDRGRCGYRRPCGPALRCR